MPGYRPFGGPAKLPGQTVVVEVRCGGDHGGRRCDAYVGELMIDTRFGTAFVCGHPFHLGGGRTGGPRMFGGTDRIYDWELPVHGGSELLPDELTVMCYRERHSDVVVVRSDLKRAWDRFRRGPGSKPIVIVAYPRGNR